MHILSKFLLIIALLMTVSGPAMAQKVIATGVGPSRDAAIKEATRNAVEQAVGSYIESRTQVNSGKLDLDRVVASTAGYVKSYDVLAEGKDPIEDTYKVKLEADVDDYKLEDTLTAFLNDPRFKKTFQRTQFDQRRVMILYSRRTPEDLPYRSKGVQTLMSRVRDNLMENGFRVFLPDQLERNKENVIDRMIDRETAMRLGQAENADAVVVTSIDAGAQKTEDNLVVVRAALSLEAYDPATGALFAEVQERGKALSHADSYSLEDAVAKVAIKSGGTASDALTQKIVKRLSTTIEKFSVLAFTEVTMDTQDGIEDLLHTLGWDYRINTQESRYLEVEVFSDMRPTDLRRTFSKAAEQAGLSIHKDSAKGARILFTGQ